MHQSSKIAAAFILSAAASVSSGAESLYIPADRIYTAPEAKPLERGGVLITNGRIVAVADEATRLRMPKETRTSDCRGVVVAGFQNSHVHFLGKPFEGAAVQPAAKLEAAVESMLTRYGFTTVFDTSSVLDDTLAIRSRIERREIRGPRIFTVGWGLFPPDGIPFYIRDLPPAVLAKLPQPRDAAEARSIVRANLAGGAEGTKLFLETTPAPGTTKTLTADVARVAAEETHARGKLLFAHPTSLAGLRAGLDAGVDVFVHTTLGEKEPWDEALVRRMVAQRVSVIPTFKLWHYELAKQHVPPDITEQLVAATLSELRAFKAGGGQILFGTDVGYMHEYDPTDEYVLMQKAGLTPLEILESLTTAPAARFGETAQRGRVQPGLAADLVVLEADPVADVKNFARVRCAFRAGELIYPAQPH